MEEKYVLVEIEEGKAVSIYLPKDFLPTIKKTHDIISKKNLVQTCRGVIKFVKQSYTLQQLMEILELWDENTETEQFYNKILELCKEKKLLYRINNDHSIYIDY